MKTAFAATLAILINLFACSALAEDTDLQFRALLTAYGFSGRIEEQLPARLGRPIDAQLADLGRLLFFDKIPSLHDDNACAGCHSPANGFGDSQSIAIGIQNNGFVGPHRKGPRNQRRTPMLINDAFFPTLMWNGRFSVNSGDPFDNSLGFTFPAPEGMSRFPANDRRFPHLLAAQGHMPPTEMTEVAGFTGTRHTISPEFDQFDDGLGTPVPPPDASGFRNEPIREAVLARLNASVAYRALFGRSFPEVANGAPITFAMFGQAIAEFQFTLVFANSPLDRFARGEISAMTPEQKRGATLFFGEAGCVSCHQVSCPANEMFSDFTNRKIGVPQLAPAFGLGRGNVIFDGPGQNEDFGAEQISGSSADRYHFRTSPLRNLAIQAAFFHDGSFTRLEDAVRHHLDPIASALQYDPARAGVDPDLRRTGPPVIEGVDPLLFAHRLLSEDEVQSLVIFLQDGLFDARATPENLCRLVPKKLPSGMLPLIFQGCPN
jgi:cytochrome c peroxidase